MQKIEERSAGFPTVVDVVAHFLDELRHKVRADGFMPAALDFHARRTEISGITTDAGESFAMKRKNERQSQFEDPALKRGLNGFDTGVVLAKAIAGFGGRASLGIGNERGFECPAISPLAPAFRHRPLA